MNHKSSNPSSTPVQPHCRHRTPSGRRCLQPISGQDSSLCFKHAVRHQKDRDAADLAAALTGRSDDFQTAAGINHSLGELYLLLAQNRISPRRAAVLAYINNLLLRTLPAMDRELGAQSPGDAAGSAIIVDLPRPIRSETSQPS